MATKAKSAREIGETFDRLAREIEAGRELDKLLGIAKGDPLRRERIAAVAYQELGFPYDLDFTQAQVLAGLLVKAARVEKNVPAVPKASSAPGRPPRGVAVNGAAFKGWRGHHTQEKFAEICDVAISTIQRVESSLPIGKPLLMKIIERGNTKFTRQITIADLT